ncbi:MAG TPA: hypothetical protein VHC20_03275 [Candidatus Paceibacterota bacterium]|nr:hypothetical protein [Candidatus Paceibacterota bacterium]
MTPENAKRAGELAYQIADLERSIALIQRAKDESWVIRQLVAQKLVEIDNDQGGKSLTVGEEHGIMPAPATGDVAQAAFLWAIDQYQSQLAALKAELEAL